MLLDICSLLLEVVFGLFGLACLLRLHMQYVGASFSNPIGQLVMRFTDWLVLPLRRRLPNAGRLDLASLIAAYASALLHLALIWALVAALQGGAAFGASAGELVAVLLWRAVVETLRLGVQLLSAVVIVAAVMSWLRPATPIYPLTMQLSEPLLAPVRRVLPTPGGLDLSPLVVLVALQIVLIVLRYL